MIRTRFVRSIAMAAAFVTLSGVAAACSNSSEEVAKTADGRTLLRYEGSVGQVLYPELAADLGYFEDVQLDWIGDSTSGPQSIQNAATGQTDFGGAFNGAIVKLAAAGSPITSVIGYYGSDKETFNGYYVLEGGPITSARDLIGKKVGMNTLGAHSEFVVREWLAREGLTPDEIKQVELVVVPPINTEQALRQGQIDVGTLGSVFRDSALERGGLRELFTDESLFGSFTYGTNVFRDEYIAKNEEAVADFVQGTARAIRWVQTHPREEVIDKFTSIINSRGRNEDTKLTSYWKSPGVAGPGGVITEAEISTWIDWLTRNGELEDGKLVPSDIYTNAFNPYANGTFAPNSGADGEIVEAAK